MAWDAYVTLRLPGRVLSTSVQRRLSAQSAAALTGPRSSSVPSLVRWRTPEPEVPWQAKRSVPVPWVLAPRRRRGVPSGHGVALSGRSALKRD
jgi:hypothetical protein